MWGRKHVAAGTMVLGTTAALALATPGALAAVPHTVQPGESLWSIAAANNFTTASVAAYNGLSPDALVYVGETLQIPSESEGAAALASAPSTPTTASTPTAGSHTVVAGETLSGIAAANGVSTDALAAANGVDPTAFVIIGQTLSVPVVSASMTSAGGISLTPIYCPCGTVYLRSDAASGWNAMRSSAQSTYGEDIYPGGPASAYRTYDQQAQLYQDYLNGTGAPANAPGTSSHELGTAVDVATPSMRSIIDSIGSTFGWGKIHGPGEWWHVDYLGGG